MKACVINVMAILLNIATSKNQMPYTFYSHMIWVSYVSYVIIIKNHEMYSISEPFSSGCQGFQPLRELLCWSIWFSTHSLIGCFPPPAKKKPHTKKKTLVYRELLREKGFQTVNLNRAYYLLWRFAIQCQSLVTTLQGFTMERKSERSLLKQTYRSIRLASFVQSQLTLLSIAKAYCQERFAYQFCDFLQRDFPRTVKLSNIPNQSAEKNSLLWNAMIWGVSGIRLVHDIRLYFVKFRPFCTYKAIIKPY